MTRYKRQDPEITRRKFINASMGGAAAIGVVSLVSALGAAKPAFRLTPDKAPPLPGDVLVHAAPDKEGQLIKLEELGEQLVNAWAMGKDKDGRDVVRKGDPNNLIAVFRFAKGSFKEPEEGAHAELKLDGIVDGEIVAYSNKCTHAGCPVPNDAKDATLLFCPCHSGQYDAKQGCKPIGGPPPRAMPQLPIKLDGERLVVTESFITAPFGFLNDRDWETYVGAAKEIVG